MVTDENSFHAWVECEGHIIDFMSPLFRECLQRTHTHISIPRLMMQKPALSSAESFEQLKRNGDFLLFPDLQLTHRLFDRLDENPINADLMNICTHFFRKNPQPWPKEMTIGDSREGKRNLKIQAPEVTGKW